MNNWFVGFAFGMLLCLAYDRLAQETPIVEVAITTNDIVEAYTRGKRDALRTAVPSLELERACVQLWSERQGR